jgi:hypothetical protein
MRALLTGFFARGHGFDYRDCSLGNLVFAGAYLEQDSDFKTNEEEGLLNIVIKVVPKGISNSL